MNRSGAARLVAEFRRVATTHRRRTTTTLEMAQNRKVADAFHVRTSRMNEAREALTAAGHDALAERLREERAALDRLRAARVMYGDDSPVVWTYHHLVVETRRRVADALNAIPSVDAPD